MRAQGWASPGVEDPTPVLTPFSTSGTPAFLRLQTLGARLPTQLLSWNYSPGQGAQGTQLRPQHPLPRTSSKGAPSPFLTLGLGPTWMWAPNQCTDHGWAPPPLLLAWAPSQISSSLPPGL